MDMKAIKKLLMGESGKTISDADRQRVMNMLGKSGAKKKKSIIEKQMDIVMPGQQTMNKGGKVAPKKMMGGGAAKKARKMRGGGGVAPKKMRGGGAAKQVSPRKLMAMGFEVGGGVGLPVTPKLKKVGSPKLRRLQKTVDKVKK